MPKNNSNPHILGRTIEVFEAPWEAKDVAFCSIRVDEEVIENGQYEHCTFANVSFLKSKLTRSHFLNCTFVECYFRRAELRNSSFVGCRFVDCNFDRIGIFTTEFSFSTFRGCFIPFDELKHNLPSQPNIRKTLTHNLFLESSKLRFSDEARKYRLEAIKAREAHLRAAIKADSQWYRDHFDAPARAQACWKLAVSKANHVFWGYGESAKHLLANVLVLYLFVIPVGYHAGNALVKHPSEDSATVSFLECIVFSVVNVFPTGIDVGINPVGPLGLGLVYLESIYGLLAIALFASHIFRWSLSR